MLKKLFIILILISCSQYAYSQSWSGIIAPSRATDWSTAGAQIPTNLTQCGSTIAPYTGSPNTINAAISNCTAGHFVQLGTGTFNLSGGIDIGKSGVVLRGTGADTTILNISGDANTSCHWGLGRSVSMCTNNGTNIGVDSPEHTANWTAGYAQGSNVITVSNTTGLVVGSTIWIDQADDTGDWPATGDLRVCDSPSGVCSNSGGGENYARSGRGLVEGHVVTAISGTNVTIEPAIFSPNFRTSQSPGAWWGNSATILKDAGLEDLSIKGDPGTGGVYVVNATNVWIKGVRLVQDNPNSANAYLISTIQCVHCTFRDNYLFGPPTTQLVNIYDFAIHMFSAGLVQNNIVHSSSAAIVLNSTVYGSVISFNYIDNTLGASIIEHGLTGQNLIEGNNGSNYSSDIIHSTHQFTTLFRNHWDSWTHNPDQSETEAGLAMYTRARFFNSIGNVFGHSHWTAYQTDQAHNGNAIYETGWQGTGSGTTAPNDARVKPTLFRWGNWDNVTNAVRWCGNSSNTGWATTCASTSEVPTTITNFRNAVPASETLPTSFYLPGQPAWWSTPFGTPPWPAIGPDVTGSSVATTGGHAYKIPARLCFENSANDPAFPSLNPRPKLFRASSCYASGPADTTNPSTPTGLSATAVSSTQINLSWTASTDNIAVTGYKVFRNGTQVGTSGSTSYQVTGLSAATSYSFTVAAYDSAGNNSAQSSPVSGTTLAPAAPPVLSNIAASNITITTAAISWTTNIAADSQVEYGLTTSYGSQTTLNASLVTSHTQTLSGLSAGATYNFRVKSREATGSLSTSSNFTFITTAPPPGNPPLVYLMLDETGGTVAADSSGNSLNGTVIGGAPFVAGHSGNAIKLNGTTQSVDLGSPAALGLTGSMTVSAWINSSAFPADDAAIVSGGTIGFQLDTSVDPGARRIGFKLSNSSGSMMARYGSATMTANTWYYVTGVYNATAQTLDVYLNGNLDNGTLVGTVTNTQRNPSLSVSVGRRIGTTGLEFAGMIDDVKVYGRALTPAEIQADMNGAVPPVPLVDATPPTVSLTAPANGSSVSGSSVSVSATASDNIGVVGVQFKLDGANLGTEDIAAPYSITWNASTVANGSHSLTAVARDAAGNQQTSATVSLTVNNSDITPPTVSLTAPATGATVSGSSVAVSANASDAVGVVGVQFLLDGVNLGPEDASAPYSISWDTTAVAGGTHTLAAKARDAAGNQTTSSSVTVTVLNTTPASALAYLKFDESGGTVAFDSSANALNGTLVNGPTFVGGKIGNAISLNGSTQYVDLGNPAALQLTGSMTVSAWINSSSFPADDSAIVSGGTIGFQLDTSVDPGARRIGFKLSNSSGSMMARYGSSTMTANTWYYVTGVYNATAQTLDVYLNGNLDNGTLAGTITNTQRNPSLSVSVGRRAGTTGLEFAGIIDDVRIYGRALTAAEIQADMNGAVPPVPPPPVDTTLPTVSLTAPANGSSVSGSSVPVAATASDDIGVVGVQFKLDGANLGTEDTAAPYSITWNATTIPNGSHSLTAVARDAAGNQRTSSAVTVTVNNPDTTPPTVSLTAPAASATVFGSSVSVSATASDNVGVAGVQFKLDGTNLLAEDTTSPYSISWDTTTVANGSHSLTAVARDAAGNQQTSATVTLTVNNPDITPPTVALTVPAAGATVSGPSVIVSANASDAVGVVGVQFLLDGVNLGPEDANAPYSISWDTTAVAGGTHTLAAKARDAAGNQTTSSSITVTVSNTSPGSSALAYLNFDESGGTVAADSSGNGLNGTLVNGPAFVAGKIGNAISLDGSTQYVNIGNPAALQLTGSMTISAWINSSSFPADDSAIVSGGTIGFQLDTSADTGARRIGFKLSNSSGAMMARYGSTTLATNTWYYVTGVYNATTKTIDVYLNGTLNNGTLAGTVTNTQRLPSLSVSIGRRSGTTGLEFAGKIDDVRIYGRALTQAEIQADMNGPAPVTVAPLSATLASTSALTTTIARDAAASQTTSSTTVDIYPGKNVFGAAAQNLRPGDTLVVHQGIYTETKPVSIDVKGTPAAPIVVTGAAGEPGPTIQSALNIGGSTYLTIRGLEIIGNGGDGVQLTGGASHVIIEQNLIHDSLPGSKQGDGISVEAGSHSNIIRDNVIYNRSHSGISVYGTGASPVNVVEGNAIWNCLEGIYAVSDAMVRNNIVFNSGTGLSLYGNAQVLQMKNVTAVNNTLYNNTIGVNMQWSSSAASMVLANNAIYSPGKTALSLSQSVGTFAANYIAGGTDRVLDSFSFIDGGTVTGAFTDPANMDLWPRAGSILIGRALGAYSSSQDFNQTVRASAIDIGAYETNGLTSNLGWKIAPDFKFLP